VAKPGQVGEEGRDLGFSGQEVCAGPPAAEPDESDDPLHRGTLGRHGVMVEPEPPTDLIEEFRWLTALRVRPRRLLDGPLEGVDKTYEANLPENSTKII
jgi:hypothetical protein